MRRTGFGEPLEPPAATRDREDEGRLWTMRTRSHALGRSRKLEHLLVAGLAAAALLLAPALLSGQEADLGEKIERAPITVVVVNNNWSDMVIYALSQGTRIRLATVTTNTREEIVLPRYLNADVRELELLADPIGGHGAVLSDPLLLNAGDVVEWHLQNQLSLSGRVVNR